ncbi:unnamed protein product [Cuscuta campestris]|uniref:Potassium transporter n=1 Tax=Cuscuta campestris TaxID=132261 RepID=A0A484NK45_9ASTE|nr:unnamed protein product [Cuscuta campestris]
MHQADINREEDDTEQPFPLATTAGEGSIHVRGQEGQGAVTIKKQLDPKVVSLVNISRDLLLAYQSLGVVYGDLSTSPLYVYQNIFVDKLQKHQTPDAIFGAFSLIFWTLTLMPLLKYVVVVLSADDNGEGGSFALYSLLCRHAKLNLLPNQQAADEELSAYKYGSARLPASCLPLKRFIERHKKARTVLFLVVLLGASMVIGDGVLTPPISVLSSVSGIQNAAKSLPNGAVLLITCIILVGLFALQHVGTHRVAFLFAPIVAIWLISIFSLGLYNTIVWNPKIVSALSPHYIIKFFRDTGRDGWISLGGVLLSVTGTEAMFADLGHFNSLSMRLAFVFGVYPCLVVQYMGQAAFLSKNIASVSNSFYASVPGAVHWPVFSIATLAAIVASQSIITATFSIIKQCNALGCFPRVKIVHTSKHIYGQIYIPEINWILMILTLSVAIGFQDVTLIGNAYGLACITVMFITTFLMSLIIVLVWGRNPLVAAAFLIFFWFIELLYLSASVIKIPRGGWVSLVLSLVFLFVMFVWHYGTRKKYTYDLHNKVPLKWLLGLGPTLGIVRVPGIGLIYSELATGVPSIFSHFVTNLPAFHSVLVFVCVKYVPVPYVSPEERFLIGRVCPRPYRMYRCIIRYGYKDTQSNNGDFEDQLIQSIAEFIQMEATEPHLSSSESSSFDGRMAVISSISRTNEAAPQSVGPTLMVVRNDSDDDENETYLQSSSKSATLQSLRSAYNDENLQVRKRRVRFRLGEVAGGVDVGVREELMELIKAKEAGVAYILGHSYVKARRSSPFLKKYVIDIAYSFLRKNCRGPSVALNIPHISLIEVGMIYYV